MLPLGGLQSGRFDGGGKVLVLRITSAQSPVVFGRLKVYEPSDLPIVSRRGAGGRRRALFVVGAFGRAEGTELQEPTVKETNREEDRQGPEADLVRIARCSQAGIPAMAFSRSVTTAPARPLRMTAMGVRPPRSG